MASGNLFHLTVPQFPKPENGHKSKKWIVSQRCTEVEQHKAYKTFVDLVVTPQVQFPRGVVILVGKADLWMEHRKGMLDNEIEIEAFPVDISYT